MRDVLMSFDDDDLRRNRFMNQSVTTYFYSNSVVIPLYSKKVSLSIARASMKMNLDHQLTKKRNLLKDKSGDMWNGVHIIQRARDCDE